MCPKCCIPLQTMTYEGTDVHQCAVCRGVLVDENNIKRIIIRQEYCFSDKVAKMAQVIQNEEKIGKIKIVNRDPKLFYICPKCRHLRAKMLRMFYTEAYRVEVDKCLACGLVWFDKDELEILQYLIDHTVEQV